MALIELKMKVYKPKYNYPNMSTMTETQREEYLNEQEQKEYEDDNELETWLEERCTRVEIFKMTKNEHNDIDKEWRESCRDYAESCFEDDYEEEEITLRVEEEDLNSHESFRLISI